MILLDSTGPYHTFNCSSAQFCCYKRSSCSAWDVHLSAHSFQYYSMYYAVHVIVFLNVLQLRYSLLFIMWRLWEIEFVVTSSYPALKFYNTFSAEVFEEKYKVIDFLLHTIDITVCIPSVWYFLCSIEIWNTQAYDN